MCEVITLKARRKKTTKDVVHHLMVGVLLSQPSKDCMEPCVCVCVLRRADLGAFSLNSVTMGSVFLVFMKAFLVHICPFSCLSPSCFYSGAEKKSHHSNSN